MVIDVIHGSVNFELLQDLKHRTCLFIADNKISFRLKIWKR